LSSILDLAISIEEKYQGQMIYPVWYDVSYHKDSGGMMLVWQSFDCSDVLWSNPFLLWGMV